MEEAPIHPHLRARGSFVELDGVVHPAASPRFSRTPAATPRPQTGPSNYSAAKAGLIGLAKALVIEEGRYGITASCVARPEDVAGAVAFLVSERAGFISGEVVHGSGGRFG